MPGPRQHQYIYSPALSPTSREVLSLERVGLVAGLLMTLRPHRATTTERRDFLAPHDHLGDRHGPASSLYGALTSNALSVFFYPQLFCSGNVPPRCRNTNYTKAGRKQRLTLPRRPMEEAQTTGRLATPVRLRTSRLSRLLSGKIRPRRRTGTPTGSNYLLAYSPERGLYL